MHALEPLQPLAIMALNCMALRTPRALVDFVAVCGLDTAETPRVYGTQQSMGLWLSGRFSRHTNKAGSAARDLSTAQKKLHRCASVLIELFIGDPWDWPLVSRATVAHVCADLGESPFTQNFVPSVLFRHPGERRWSGPFDAAAIAMVPPPHALRARHRPQFAFPRGAQLRREDDERRPACHSFLVTKDDGSRGAWALAGHGMTLPISVRLRAGLPRGRQRAAARRGGLQQQLL